MRLGLVLGPSDGDRCWRARQPPSAGPGMPTMAQRATSRDRGASAGTRLGKDVAFDGRTDVGIRPRSRAAIRASYERYTPRTMTPSSWASFRRAVLAPRQAPQ